MWKKLGVVFISLLCIMGATYAYESKLNNEMEAKVVFYGKNDKLSKDSHLKLPDEYWFKMGGLNWSIVYSDESTGRGIIAAQMVEGIGPAAISLGSRYYKATSTLFDAKFSEYQTGYASRLADPDPNKNDAIGKQVIAANPGKVDVLRFMTISEYRKVTNDGKDLSYLQRAYSYNTAGGMLSRTWIGDWDDINSIMYGIDIGCPIDNLGAGVQHLSKCPSTSSLSGSFMGVFEINLPVKSSNPDIKYVSTSVPIEKQASANSKAKMGEIDIIAGKTYMIETGNTNYVDEMYDGTLVGGVHPLSDQFIIDTDTGISGIAYLRIGNSALTEGTYYVKVKMSPTGESIVIKIDVANNPYALTYTSSHGSSITDYYQSGTSGNVNVGDQIGNGVFTSDISGVNYQIVSPSSAKSDMTSYKMLDVDTSGMVSLKSGSGSYNYLLPGVYYYRIQGYNASNLPSNLGSGVTKPVDTSFNPISDAYDQNDTLLTYGLLSDDIEMVVYPNDALLDYAQAKDTTSSTYRTKAQLNALSDGADVGTLTFQNDANINALKAKGYMIKGIQLVKKGTTTPLTEIIANADSGNVNLYKIQKKSGGTFSGGDISFDAIIEFEKGGSVISQITKGNMTFIVPEGLQFVDPDNNASFLASSSYSYTYDPSSSTHDFTLTATDKASTSSLNPNVSYCILDTSNICTSTSSVITLSTGAPSGSQKITVSAPGTSDKTVNVRASLIDASNTVITYEDIALTIHPTTQTLSWSGTNIAKTGNNVKLKSGSTDTWEISMRYSGSGIDTYTIEELLNTATATSGNFGVSSNVASGSLNLTYNSTYTNASDNTKVFLSGGTGAKVLNVAGNPTGKMTIEVDSSAVGDYTKSNSIYLEINVDPSLNLKYTPLYTGNISASSSYATANAVLGDIQVQPTTETGYTYSITSITSGGVTLNGTFSIDSTNGQLKVGTSNLAVGTYDVSVQASKNGENTKATYTITVVNAAFPIASWKWQEDSSGSYKDVGGNFDSAFINTTTLSNTYEASKSIQVRLNGVNPTANVVYSLDGTTTGVINVTDKGSYAIIDILGASPVSSDVKIKATVSDPNGVYTTQDVWIPVDIKKYPQKIKFQDASNLYLPNTAPCTQIPVVKDSIYWNQSGANPVILSTTSSAFTISGDKICPVVGQSVTGATLTANLNGDGNFDAASAITKTIHIYDPGMITVTQSIDSVSGGASNVVYTPGTILEAMNNSSTNPLGSAKINAISANVKLSGIASASSNAYVLSTNTGNANIDAPLFTVAPNGNIALNQDISASDLMAHGSNIYKIQVDVKDVHNYVQTVDVKSTMHNQISTSLMQWQMPYL